MNPLVTLIVGTRPDAIKMAPLALELRRQPGLSVRLVNSGQHRDLVGPALGAFGLTADVDLGAMRDNQPLEQLVSRLIEVLGAEFRHSRPRWVLGHGDTATCFGAALAAFYQQIPFGHVEAGLRSHDLGSPFPEEFHRRVVARHSAHHFAPDHGARENLLREGTASRSISITGNTVGDALFRILSQGTSSVRREPGVVVTWHRREGQGFLGNLASLARHHGDVRFYFPVHPAPRVRDQVRGQLSGLSNVELMAPLDYGAFISLLSTSLAVVTDSGGVQEEAAMLGRPALLIRDRTERKPTAGATLVGRTGGDLVGAFQKALGSAPYAGKIAVGASKRITDIMVRRLTAE